MKTHFFSLLAVFHAYAFISSPRCGVVPKKCTLSFHHISVSSLKGCRMTSEAPSSNNQQIHINQTCNKIVKTILLADTMTVENDLKIIKEQLLNDRGLLIIEGDVQSEIFYENLLCVCDHSLHPDLQLLKGRYANAWRSMLHYIEDAGWQLTDPPFKIAG